MNSSVNLVSANNRELNQFVRFPDNLTFYVQKEGNKSNPSKPLYIIKHNTDYKTFIEIESGRRFWGFENYRYICKVHTGR